MRSRWHAAVVGTICCAIGGITAACGGADEPDAAPKPPPTTTSRPAPAAPPAVSFDACTLLTRAEAEAALGQPVGDPLRGDVPPVFSCSYVTASRLNNVQMTVTLYADAREAHDAYVMTLEINNYPEITGLGDRAYRSPISDVSVLKGRYQLSVDVSLSIDKDAQVDKAKALAAQALARLPQ